MSCDFLATIVLKQCLCCIVTVTTCFQRLCVFIAFFYFHLLVKLFTLPAVFGLVNKDLQCLLFARSSIVE